MKTILVTGGAGFIGSCFVRRAVSRRDCRVLNLDKLTYANNPDSLYGAKLRQWRIMMQNFVSGVNHRSMGTSPIVVKIALSPRHLAERRGLL